MEKKEALKILEGIVPGGAKLAGALKVAIEAIKKQIPAAPVHYHREYSAHKWQRKEDGEIDTFAFDYDYHNGVACTRCNETVCVHCNPNWRNLKEKCVVDRDNCPNCGKSVYNVKHCQNCGQALNWKRKGAAR